MVTGFCEEGIGYLPCTPIAIGSWGCGAIEGGWGCGTEGCRGCTGCGWAVACCLLAFFAWICLFNKTYFFAIPSTYSRYNNIHYIYSIIHSK